MYKSTLLIQLFFTFAFVFQSRVACQTNLFLPNPTGAYAVGINKFEFSDNTRKMLRSNDVKRWTTTVFYPTKDHCENAPYFHRSLAEGLIRSWKIIIKAKIGAEPCCNHKFPTIIFVPGRGNEAEKYSILCSEIASHGYIVIATDQPYVAGFVKFADGSKIVPTFWDVLKVPKDRDYRYKYDDIAIAGAIGDIKFLLGHFENFGKISKCIDQEKIVLMGHSIGGNIANILGFSDERIKAVVDIDSKITERSVYGNTAIPLNPKAKPALFIRGMLQYQENLGDKLTKRKNANAWLPKVEHSAFSDEAFLSAKIKDFDMGFMEKLYRWFFKTGPVFYGLDVETGASDINEWFSFYTSNIVSYLNQIRFEKITTSSIDKLKNQINFVDFESLQELLELVINDNKHIPKKDLLFFFDLDDTIIEQKSEHTSLKNQSWPAFLKQIQKQGFETIALSGAPVYRFKDRFKKERTSCVSERLKLLSNLNVYFSHNKNSDERASEEQTVFFGEKFNFFAKESIFHAQENDPKIKSNKEVDYKNIVLQGAIINNIVHTDFLKKDLALKSLFSEAFFQTPKKLVFVDDLIDNCTDVLNFCKEYKIDAYIFKID